MELEITKVHFRKTFERKPYDRRPEPKSRLYVHLDSKPTGPDGKTSPAEFFANRFEQPSREFRKLIPQIMAKVREGLVEVAAFDSRMVGLEAKWSQYAGCSCPCSPGFVLNRRFGFDIWADVTVLTEDNSYVELAAR